MKIQKLFSTTFILMLVFTLAACNLPGGAPLGGPTPTPTRLGGSSPDDGGSGSPGGGIGGGSGSCANPLWPVVSGAYWSYESNDSVLGQYTFTSTVTEVGTDGFGLTNEYSTGVTAAQAWQCQAGNLISLSVGGGTAATLSTDNGTNAHTETTGNSGVTLPALVSPGDAWSQTMNLSGTVTLTDGNSGSSEGAYVADYSAVGIESISVPAGSFEAMRIEMNSVYTLNITVEGMTVPTVVNNAATLWYAPGVGLVMSVNTNDIMGTETITLTGYNVP